VVRSAGRHAGAEALLSSGGDVLHRLLDASRRPDWAWFEAVLAYDNPRLSQALIEAGELCGRPEWTRAGLETLEWISARQTASNGTFRPIGSDSFGRAGIHLPFDQQPLEAQAAVEAAEAAYRVTADARWLDHARAAYAWFFGANDRCETLADLATGRCRDGLTPRGRNENCGAESILAFQLAHYSLQRMQQVAQARSAAAVPLWKAAPAETHYLGNRRSLPATWTSSSGERLMVAMTSQARGSGGARSSISDSTGT
jgi:hypothetical protein